MRLAAARGPRSVCAQCLMGHGALDEGGLVRDVGLIKPPSAALVAAGVHLALWREVRVGHAGGWGWSAETSRRPTRPIATRLRGRHEVRRAGQRSRTAERRRGSARPRDAPIRSNPRDGCDFYSQRRGGTRERGATDQAAWCAIDRTRPRQSQHTHTTSYALIFIFTTLMNIERHDRQI